MRLAVTRAGTAALALASLIAFAGGPVRAQDLQDPATAGEAPRGSEARADETSADAALVVQYDVEIVGPGGIVGLLRADLDLLRWRSYPGMNRDLLERLVAEARDHMIETLATEGYFSPTVRPEVIGEARPWTVRFDVDPGPETTVSEVRVEVTGSITRVAARAERRRVRILDLWPLPVGARFRQQDWDRAKRSALEQLAEDRFAGASLQQTRATIDPATRQAVLELVVDSGPEFRYGQIEIRGLDRYPESVVRNLATFKPGDPFDHDDLVLFQRRLSATGYFSAVQVEMDNAAATASAAPVRVSLLEGNSRRVEAGIGYSTDTLYQLQFGYTDNNFRDRGWRWRNDARFESRANRASSTITLPARSNGWQHAFALRYTDSDVAGLSQRAGNFTVSTRSINERRQPQWSIGTHIEQQQPEGERSDTVTATFLGYRYTRRDIDELLSPRRGTILSGQLGVAPPGLSTRGFVRGVGQAALYLPLGKQNSLVFHAEGGAVGARDGDGIPQSFLFRTGGDTKVRGYAFESIGVERGAAVVGGRYYAVASVEAIRWMSELWGVAAFYDVGNAAGRLRELQPFAQGAGVGARVRTPLGPIRVDLAYGERTRAFRLHLSLGVNF